MRSTKNSHNKDRRLPAEPLTATEIKMLLQSCSQRSSTGIRNRALLAMLYRTGIRISEALSIMPKDLDTQCGSLRVLFGKGKRSRVVGLDAGALALLQVWLERRATLGITGRSPVFCTLKGQPMKSGYVRNWLPRLARKAGVERRVHAHCFRHTFAYEAANEGTPLHLLQQQLGHQWLATTDRYIRHLHPATVIEAMKNRDWTL